MGVRDGGRGFLACSACRARRRKRKVSSSFTTEANQSQEPVHPGSFSFGWNLAMVDCCIHFFFETSSRCFHPNQPSVTCLHPSFPQACSLTQSRGLRYSRSSASSEPGVGTSLYPHMTCNGKLMRIDSTRPNVLRPNMVPRS